MGADLIVDRRCRPKRAFGKGDQLEGTVVILEKLKARHRARQAIDVAARQGDPAPEDLTLVVGTEATEREIRVGDLLATAAPLDSFAKYCVRCPANVRGGPYGCYVDLPYPVLASAQEWLMDRLLPFEDPGGFLCHRAMRDFGYTGEAIQELRVQGLVELTLPVEKELGDRTVNSNQVLEAILAAGGGLNPAHCLGVTLWFGGVRLDGVPAQSSDAIRAVHRVREAATRRRRVDLELGPPSDDPGVTSMQAMLRALFGAWQNAVPLLVDA